MGLFIFYNLLIIGTKNLGQNTFLFLFANLTLLFHNVHAKSLEFWMFLYQEMPFIY
jgi:hypothetical protein